MEMMKMAVLSALLIFQTGAIGRQTAMDELDDERHLVVDTTSSQAKGSSALDANSQEESYRWDDDQYGSHGAAHRAKYSTAKSPPRNAKPSWFKTVGVRCQDSKECEPLRCGEPQAHFAAGERVCLPKARSIETCVLGQALIDEESGLPLPSEERGFDITSNPECICYSDEDCKHPSDRCSEGTVEGVKRVSHKGHWNDQWIDHKYKTRSCVPTMGAKQAGVRRNGDNECASKRGGGRMQGLLVEGLSGGVCFPEKFSVQEGGECYTDYDCAKASLICKSVTADRTKFQCNPNFDPPATRNNKVGLLCHDHEECKTRRCGTPIWTADYKLCLPALHSVLGVDSLHKSREASERCPVWGPNAEFQCYSNDDCSGDDRECAVCTREEDIQKGYAKYYSCQPKAARPVEKSKKETPPRKKIDVQAPGRGCALKYDHSTKTIMCQEGFQEDENGYFYMAKIPNLADVGTGGRGLWFPAPALFVLKRYESEKEARKAVRSGAASDMMMKGKDKLGWAQLDFQFWANGNGHIYLPLQPGDSSGAVERETWSSCKEETGKHGLECHFCLSSGGVPGPKADSGACEPNDFKFKAPKGGKGNVLVVQIGYRQENDNQVRKGLNDVLFMGHGFWWIASEDAVGWGEPW